MGEAARLLDTSDSERYTKVKNPNDVARLYEILRENPSFSDVLAVKRKGIELGHNGVLGMACETLVRGEQERALTLSLGRSYSYFSEQPIDQEIYSALESVCKAVGREISQTELGAATTGIFEYVSEPVKEKTYGAIRVLDKYLRATEGPSQVRAAASAAMQVIKNDPARSKIVGALENLGSILRDNPIEDENVVLKLADAYDALTPSKEEVFGLFTHTARAMIRQPTDRECHEALFNAARERGWSIDDPQTAVGYFYQRLYGEDFRDVSLKTTEKQGEDGNEYIKEVPYNLLTRNVQEQIHLSLLVKKGYITEDQRKKIVERMQEKIQRRKR